MEPRERARGTLEDLTECDEVAGDELPDDDELEEDEEVEDALLEGIQEELRPLQTVPRGLPLVSASLTLPDTENRTLDPESLSMDRELVANVS